MKGNKIVPQLMGSALAIIAVFVFRTYTKIDPPAEVGIALGTLMAGLVAVITPNSLEAE